MLLKRLERALGRIGLKLAWGLFRYLPMGLAIRLGALVGLLGYALSARYRRVAIGNLQRAFPDWSRSRVRATARRTFRNFGVGLAEFLKAPSMTLDQLEQRVELRGREHLDAAFREGKGVLLLTGHFGNWELMARYLVLLGYPIVVIARPTEDPATTDLITMVRERCGYRVYERGNAARAVLKALRANEGVGILPDQNAGDVFVEFFGQKAGCVAGPAIFHLRTGAPIVPLFNVRLPGDYHRIEILPPIHFEPPECFSPSPVHSAGGSHPEKKILSGDWQADVQRIMQAWHDILESYVRRYPDQWLWLHDRWKSGRKLTAKTPA